MHMYGALVIGENGEVRILSGFSVVNQVIFDNLLCDRRARFEHLYIFIVCACDLSSWNNLTKW